MRSLEGTLLRPVVNVGGREGCRKASGGKTAVIQEAIAQESGYISTLQMISTTIMAVPPVLVSTRRGWPAAGLRPYDLQQSSAVKAVHGFQ